MSSVTGLEVELQHVITALEHYAHAFGRLRKDGSIDESGWFAAASPVISSAVMASSTSSKEAAECEVDMGLLPDRVVDFVVLGCAMLPTRLLE
jgi:hypothetical protein